jgi:ribosomal protein S18 acetylase RimI-like enzyme
MKPINWIKFTWDLTKLSCDDPELPEHYEIALATAEDEKEVRKVISSSFVLDPTWNPAVQEVMQTIETWLAEAFQSEKSACLVLRHGLRIIGAVVLSLDAEAENHLAPGPCIIVEYRNRGFGTRLLEHSLKFLRDTGLSTGVGVAKENSPATRFLYTKFHGVAGPHDFTPLLAA